MSVDSEQAPREAAPERSRGGTDKEAAQRQVQDAFHGCEASLGRFLTQFVRDRQLAEDLLQDTFHDAFRAPAALARACSAEAWLFGIARNRALAALRRRRRFDAALSRLALRRAAEPDEVEVAAVRDLLERTLSAEDRSLVLLCYLHDFQAVELAEMTGQTPEAVRQRLARARKRLLAAAGSEEMGETIR